ncbi:DUF6126 family protein [Streptomyces clavuligerus]|uniref:DUF6126 family protein n=1 Tax=Streptomyces clavuligerus TaxID=1901 RepID=UPI00020D90DE|nr:DUF6126 family protein [Streptomyces clavuligerus]ANW17219.1 hypothetical protein BB341_02780 [Streptomyces clavuligerus]AXU11759.1 hypothetical protein D1794_02915 [Streptomyces clavuligerus]MBY6301597.1 hypothetical protein [Streptomyces clavuligerus]QCS04540.1 hypothetical protein CRV15_02350 [Streptomyces clavuligerus]QPJ96082.1 hypothetical protein GE265_25540 [Streptomyces clavuligerus]
MSEISDNSAGSAPSAAAPLPGRTQGKQEGKFPRGLVIRLFAYLIAGHVFAFFLYLLFEVGAK